MGSWRGSPVLALKLWLDLLDFFEIPSPFCLIILRGHGDLHANIYIPMIFQYFGFIPKPVHGLYVIAVNVCNVTVVRLPGLTGKSINLFK